MSRYFLEVRYKGTNYSGFQVQKNANSIQAEVEKAMEILLRNKIMLTGSSRTDAGVHALQNYFHFDYEENIEQRFIYNMNALLPEDIAVRNVIQHPIPNIQHPTPNTQHPPHCRFDATSRLYQYYITRAKDPFLRDRAYYFPFKVDMEKMNEAAAIIKEHKDFTSFSKRNTQAKTAICNIMESDWQVRNNMLIYRVKADRFLRGMVRALTATMLKLGRGRISIEEFVQIIEARDCTRASFAVPAHGLFLVKVEYPPSVAGL
jgi:tRNA pseudouridine38-40 synthase